MKIESITLHHISMPQVTPFQTSFRSETGRECIIVELHADGLTGSDECVASHEFGYSYEIIGTAWHILQEFIDYWSGCERRSRFSIPSRADPRAPSRQGGRGNGIMGITR